MEKLYIIGLGPGGETLLTAQAKEALAQAERVFSTRKTEKISFLSLSEVALELKKPFSGATAVLVSGDSGFFSIAKSIVKDFAQAYEIELLPGISSIQYLSAKLKIAYDDAVLVSLHGRELNIVPQVAYRQKIFALTGGANKVKNICQTLAHYGLGHVKVSVGERLSLPEEKIVTGTAAELKEQDFDDLAVIYLENPAAANPHLPLSDTDFSRGSAPMTKEEVRWLSLQKLGISPGDIIYDIGAGTGSVAIEMARKAFNGFVYAIEKEADACALIQENAKTHGAFNLEIINGEAPQALSNLPAPDKAFIGGSSGQMDSILETLLALNPQLKIAANAITLQSLQQILAGFAKYGIENTDIVCVNIAKAKKAGSYDMMLAQNPVYIISGAGGKTHV
ncbi:MAG: precorrin-6y C5,15-methyltransferase (decarboxylating) subunit CbiE [Sporomusaceae bacterium]|jgi:precorrin-6Y C5,15-methyltransferase (decarboxylating)|nr:precorrin-6y C5,15-methyltransferase (decarboxylating) subunit CbiE [Sporomusaceae bacterium]